MISRLDRLQGRNIYENTALAKINELVDAINTIQKEREAERFEIQEWIGILEAVRKSVNIHEKQIDELQMKAEPEKCKAPLEMAMEAEPDFITTSYMTDGHTQEYYGQNGARVQFDYPIPAGYTITITDPTPAENVQSEKIAQGFKNLKDPYAKYRKEIDYTEYWETRDGDLIRYADMTDNHLINAHNMIERKVCNFINRCASRNEEQDLPEDVEQMIEGLETEMEKRGLLEIKGGDND